MMPIWSKVMTSEVEERPRFVTGGYRRHRSQWVNIPYNACRALKFSTAVASSNVFSGRKFVV